MHSMSDEFAAIPQEMPIDPENHEEKSKTWWIFHHLKGLNITDELHDLTKLSECLPRDAHAVRFWILRGIISMKPWQMILRMMKLNKLTLPL